MFSRVLVVLSLTLAVLTPACGETPDYADQYPATDAPFGYDAYARALAEFVDDEGLVNYAGLKSSPEDLLEFVLLLGELDRAEFDGWSESERIALWINAYNALTLQAIIEHYPIEPSLMRGMVFPKNSIRQIPGVWKKLEWRVMGEGITLDRIEHGVLRVEYDEPRIHVALVCAALSCPPLRSEPFTGDRLDEQLDDQSRRFLARPDALKIDRAAGRVELSSIFSWFGDDFIGRYDGDGFDSRGEAEAAVLRFVLPFTSGEDRAFLEADRFEIDYTDYDWTLNERSRSDS